MLTFPLARNELLRQGRRADTYLYRTGVIGLVFIPLLAAWWFDTFYGDTIPINTEVVGQALAVGALTIQLLAAFLMAGMLASSALTQEKEERTLGLLMMADLRGWDIILAKFTGVMTRVITTMLCSAPFIGFAALFGAIDVPAALITLAIFSVCAIAITAVGLFFSTVISQSSSAGALTLLVVTLYILLVALCERWLYPGGINLNPFATFLTTVLLGALQFGTYIQALQDAAIACAIILALALLFILLAVWRLPHQVHREVTAPKSLAGPERRSSPRFWRHDPLARLVTACVDGIALGGRNIFLRILAFAGICSLLVIPVIGALFVMIVLFREILLSTERLRNQGVLDDFNLAPHTDTALGRAFWWGHIAAARPYFILILASFVFTAVIHDRTGLDLYEQVGTNLEIFVPITIVQYLAAVAIACFASTFAPRLGSLLAYFFMFTVTATYFGIPALYLFLRPKRIDVTFMNGEYSIFDQAIFSAAEITLYLAINIALYLALTYAACWATGRRLRHIPLINLKPNASTNPIQAPAQ